MENMEKKFKYGMFARYKGHIVYIVSIQGTLATIALADTDYPGWRKTVPVCMLREA